MTRSAADVVVGTVLRVADRAQQPTVTVRFAVGVPARSRLRGIDQQLGGLRSVLGPFPCLITEVDGPDEQLAPARAGLPAGPALAEAVAVRLRRTGTAMTCRPDGRQLDSIRELTDLCRQRGRHAVQVLRADPALLPELQIGSWFAAGWRARLIRRLALHARLPPETLPGRLAADIAFWSGVRAAASAAEWRRLTAGYVVLCYHRLAGKGIPGQERWDVAPRALRRQLRLLRLLGWRPLTAEQLRAFHDDPSGRLARRRFVITADDGFAEAVAEFTRHGRCEPQIFAVTAAVGGRAEWFGDVEVADWRELRELAAAGGMIGSHARHHVRLATLDDTQLEDELVGSLADLTPQVAPPVAVLAYPHGSHDLRVRAATVRAGYALAYTTQQGRNGAGTDRWCLRRVEPKIWDSTASFCWKVLTGESPPHRWERRLARRWRARGVRPPAPGPRSS